MRGKLATVRLLGLVLGAAVLAPGAAGQSDVASTKHNLSVSGPGPVKATEETRICVFCHTPHSGSPKGALWNRREPGSLFTPYTSSTAVASPGQPTGASLLCLSCHDGTIALGELLSEPTPISMAGGVTQIPAGPGRLGTDLSNHHPVSFQYTASLASTRGELADPSSLSGPIKLDADSELQCTACHNAHDDRFGKFLVTSNRGSAICVTCHTKDAWNLTSHQSSTATWSGAGPDPWPNTPYDNVADNGCENCHQPHDAGKPEGLLHRFIEEDNCYRCHNANVASTNIQAELNKPFRHPVDMTSNTHDPTEPAVVTTRHVECADCHNPHATRGQNALPLGPPGGVRGVGSGGAEVAPAAAEYEVCYRCHGDSPGKPTPQTTRQLSQMNVRLELSINNPSFHPVEGPGVNPDVPSLIAPLNVTSVITCTDCHNNDTGPGANGTGPRGPHGSIYPALLERQYVTADDNRESASAYALCYKCHSRNSILGDESFKKHKKHIDGENTPCNVCHDPHGISFTQGNFVNNSKLINFDVNVVFPNKDGQLRFESQGRFKGACYLRCHGKDHNPKKY